MALQIYFLLLEIGLDAVSLGFQPATAPELAAYCLLFIYAVPKTKLLIKTKIRRKEELEKLQELLKYRSILQKWKRLFFFDSWLQRSKSARESIYEIYPAFSITHAQPSANKLENLYVRPSYNEFISTGKDVAKQKRPTKPK